MAYKYKNAKGNEYYLHRRTTKLASGKERTLYFFSKEQQDAVNDVPAGYQVSETANGLPVLKKSQ
jgi:hypothetical protein